MDGKTDCKIATLNSLYFSIIRQKVLGNLSVYVIGNNFPLALGGDPPPESIRRWKASLSQTFAKTATHVSRIERKPESSTLITQTHFPPCNTAARRYEEEGFSLFWHSHHDRTAAHSSPKKKKKILFFFCGKNSVQYSGPFFSFPSPSLFFSLSPAAAGKKGGGRGPSFIFHCRGLSLFPIYVRTAGAPDFCPLYALLFFPIFPAAKKGGKGKAFREKKNGSEMEGLT